MYFSCKCTSAVNVLPLWDLAIGLQLHEIEVVGMYVCMYVYSLIHREGTNQFAANLACYALNPRGDFIKVKTPKKSPGFESR
jgi:hypothetical protein